MELNQLKKPYAPEVMKEYCRENIDKYDVDTMVCEAFQQGLIREVTAFIHLRAMDGEVYKNKIAILSRLIKKKDKKIQYIISKGRVDNHFWVRDVVNR